MRNSLHSGCEIDEVPLPPSSVFPVLSNVRVDPATGSLPVRVTTIRSPSARARTREVMCRPIPKPLDLSQLG
jgi:hypothetical protein